MCLPSEIDPGEIDPGEIDPGEIDPGESAQYAQSVLIAHFVHTFWDITHFIHTVYVLCMYRLGSLSVDKVYRVITQCAQLKCTLPSHFQFTNIDPSSAGDDQRARSSPTC